jgi:hypothetical protein
MESSALTYCIYLLLCFPLDILNIRDIPSPKWLRRNSPSSIRPYFLPKRTLGHHNRILSQQPPVELPIYPSGETSGSFGIKRRKLLIPLLLCTSPRQQVVVCSIVCRFSCNKCGPGLSDAFKEIEYLRKGEEGVCMGGGGGQLRLDEESCKGHSIFDGEGGALG